MKSCDCPLVSVVVITYNSSKTVVETMDSIANQTYQNLELIVSDDCSTDNTVDICRNWIDVNKDRFARTELLTVEKNTGVSANMNRGEKACMGEWVKPIAGDDVLLLDCIESYVDFIRDRSGAICVFANVEIFGGDEEARKAVEECYSTEEEFFNMSIEEQYDYLTLVGNHIPAATTFFNKKIISKLGVDNDERIPFIEDKPRWINLLKAGVRFDYLNKKTVKYRLSDTSLWRHTPDKFIKSQALIYIYYCFDNDYRKGDKKRAILRWIRSQKIIHNNSFGWRILVKVYKVIINEK